MQSQNVFLAKWSALADAENASGEATIILGAEPFYHLWLWRPCLSIIGLLSVYCRCC